MAINLIEQWSEEGPEIVISSRLILSHSREGGRVGLSEGGILT